METKKSRFTDSWIMDALKRADLVDPDESERTVLGHVFRFYEPFKCTTEKGVLRFGDVVLIDTNITYVER